MPLETPSEPSAARRGQLGWAGLTQGQEQSSHLPILRSIHVVEEDRGFLVEPVDVIPDGLVDLLALPLTFLLIKES